MARRFVLALATFGVALVTTAVPAQAALSAQTALPAGPPMCCGSA